MWVCLWKRHFLTTIPQSALPPFSHQGHFLICHVHNLFFVLCIWGVGGQQHLLSLNSDSAGRSPVSPSKASKLFLLSHSVPGRPSRPIYLKYVRLTGITEEESGPAWAWSLYSRCSGEPQDTSPNVQGAWKALSIKRKRKHNDDLETVCPLWYRCGSQRNKGLEWSAL